MTRPEIKIEGAKQLQRALRQVEGGTANLKDAHDAGAKIVEREAVRIVPRRSGVLAGSLRSSGQARQGVVRAGRAAVPYAGVIHFGWAKRNIAPQPYLYDAVDSRRQEVLDAYGVDVNKVIKANGLG